MGEVIMMMFPNNAHWERNQAIVMQQVINERYYDDQWSVLLVKEIIIHHLGQLHLDWLLETEWLFPNSGAFDRTLQVLLHHVLLGSFLCTTDKQAVDTDHSKNGTPVFDYNMSRRQDFEAIPYISCIHDNVLQQKNPFSQSSWCLLHHVQPKKYQH